jgi:predicted metal-dependent peptidase
MLNSFEKSFKDGLVELLYLDPNLGAIARGLGKPVVDNSVPTASLKWDKREKKVVFAVNEDFIENSDEEMVASIILHETEHLIFDHIAERIENNFPNKKVLHMAQECINNDIIDKIYQLPLPDSAITGHDVVRRDCTALSTKQVYDLILSKLPPEDGGGDGNSESQKGVNGPKRQKGNSPQAGSNNNDGENGEDDNGDDIPEDEDQQQNSGCGGIQIDSEDIVDVEDYVKRLVEDTATEIGMTADELMNEFNNTKNGGFSPTGNKIGMNSVITPTKINWKYLLSRINPKVLEAGKEKKIKYDWTKQNRRLISIYPRAIVPKVKNISPDASDKGDSIPVLVIALDLSGSIPKNLVDMLRGMLEDIPEDLIKAYPCTWGTYLYPYVPGGPLGNGGTEINNVVEYVKKIQEETRTDPYVLVITDGEFYSHYERPGKDWYFMAINDRSFNYTCVQHAQDKDHLYHIKDFKA